MSDAVETSFEVVGESIFAPFVAIAEMADSVGIKLACDAVVGAD